MTRKEKLLKKLKQRPKDLTWNELTAVLKVLGYRSVKSSKTGGSRQRFTHPELPPIVLHKPHPQKAVKRYVIDYLLELFEKEGML